jgi:hypothetical protein
VESVSTPENGNALQKLMISLKLLLVLEMKLKLCPLNLNPAQSFQILVETGVSGVVFLAVQ